MKSMILRTTGLVMIWSMVASGGHRQGNGGDHVRATFIKMGGVIADFLNETEVGQKILRDNNLSSEQIMAVNTIDVISVAEGTLIDNQGSKVEAIGEPGKIILSGDLWMEHFERNRDVYYLVLHELLRALAIDDDNYVVSAAINPFPATRRIVTSLKPVYPLLGDELLSDIMDPQKIGLSGTGCPRNLAGTIMEFDEEQNVLDIAFQRYAMVAQQENPAARKNCALVIPIKGRANKQVVITQIDFTARTALPASESEELETSALLALEAFLPGTNSAVVSRRIDAQAEQQVGRILVRKTDAVRSRCGESALLRVNTVAHLHQEGQTAALLDVDHLKVYLGVENCSSSLTKQRL